MVAALTGGALSWFASTNPDGLEWAAHRVSGKEELKSPETAIHGMLSRLQEKIALFPDYDFRKPSAPKSGTAPEAGGDGKGGTDAKGDRGVKAGTSFSGLIGGVVTLLLAGLIGLLLRKSRPGS
jgi:cobalt/nickel transport system permease protein